MIRRPTRPVALALLALSLSCALLLALPGETVATKYLNDLFIFLDGVHRIESGQVPSRDFHTALGPLNYYVPAFGYWLSGHYGGAMPVGIALLLVVLAPVAAHVIDTRMRPAIGLPLGAFLILVAAVPINLGESIGALSFAMFYNRIGWAALGILLVMYLPPSRPSRRQTWLDAACATVLVLLMLYLKASYGIVALAFMAFMLFDPRQRGWAAAALGATAVACLAVEAVWQSSAGYISDLALAGRVSGGLDTIDELAETLFRNFADYVVFAMLGGLALVWTRSLRDGLFLGFCAASGFLLISQNFQEWGIITLGAGAAVAAEALARADHASADARRWSLVSGAQLLLFAFLLPTVLHNSAALVLHAGLAGARYGETVPLPKFDRIRLARLWTEGEYPAFARYLASLKDGAQALEGLDQPAKRILVLDFVSPFSAGLGLEPPRGDSTWHHWSRTLDESNFLPPQQLFADVRMVMEPKWPIESWTATGLRQVYADYLAEHYELAQETVDWKVYVTRQTPDETVSQTMDPESDEDAESGG